MSFLSLPQWKNWTFAIPTNSLVTSALCAIQLRCQTTRTSMANFLLLAICLLFHFDSTSSLQANTVRELSGLYSNAKQYVSPVSISNSLKAGPLVLPNVSEACQNAYNGLAKSPQVAPKCKYEHRFLHFLTWTMFNLFNKRHDIRMHALGKHEGIKAQAGLGFYHELLVKKALLNQ